MARDLLFDDNCALVAYNIHAIHPKCFLKCICKDFASASQKLNFFISLPQTIISPCIQGYMLMTSNYSRVTLPDFPPRAQSLVSDMHVISSMVSSIISKLDLPKACSFKAITAIVLKKMGS